MIALLQSQFYPHSNTSGDGLVNRESDREGDWAASSFFAVPCFRVNMI